MSTTAAVLIDARPRRRAIATSHGERSMPKPPAAAIADFAFALASNRLTAMRRKNDAPHA